jgi:hypothetical protein
MFHGSSPSAWNKGVTLQFIVGPPQGAEYLGKGLYGLYV